MPLSMVTFQETPNVTWLTGVYNGQAAPVFLGQTDFSAKLGLSFHIGFDTRTKPTTVRIYFDPSSAFLSAPDWSSIGLTQIGQIRFQGTPIDPEVYGSDLAALQPYAYQDPFTPNANLAWVDMMDAARAR